MKNYVVLEHLLLPDRGLRFWRINTEGDNTLNNEEVLAYIEILITDDRYEAITESSKINIHVLPTSNELERYWSKHK